MSRRSGVFSRWATLSAAAFSVLWFGDAAAAAPVSTGRESSPPAVVSSSSGWQAISWASKAQGGAIQYFSATRDKSGAWSPSIPLPWRAEGHRVVGVDDTGRAYAVSGDEFATTGPGGWSAPQKMPVEEWAALVEPDGSLVVAGCDAGGLRLARRGPSGDWTSVPVAQYGCGSGTQLSRSTDGTLSLAYLVIEQRGPGQFHHTLSAGTFRSSTLLPVLPVRAVATFSRPGFTSGFASSWAVDGGGIALSWARSDAQPASVVVKTVSPSGETDQVLPPPSGSSTVLDVAAGLVHDAKGDAAYLARQNKQYQVLRSTGGIWSEQPTLSPPLDLSLANSGIALDPAGALHVGFTKPAGTNGRRTAAFIASQVVGKPWTAPVTAGIVNAPPSGSQGQTVVSPSTVTIVTQLKLDKERYGWDFVDADLLQPRRVADPTLETKAMSARRSSRTKRMSLRCRLAVAGYCDVLSIGIKPGELRRLGLPACDSRKYLDADGLVNVAGSETGGTAPVGKPISVRPAFNDLGAVARTVSSNRCRYMGYFVRRAVAEKGGSAVLTVKLAGYGAGASHTVATSQLRLTR